MDRFGHSINSAVCSRFLNTNLGTTIELLLFAVMLGIWHLLALTPTIIPYFVFANLSLWLRHKRWTTLGLTSPASWFIVIIVGSLTGGIIVAFTQKVLPVLFTLTNKRINPLGYIA